MQIQIATRLRPFSHRPHTTCWLPGSPFFLEVFPTRLIVQGYFTLSWDLQGPFQQFTVQQDLEKGRVLIWGKTPAGFVRYVVSALENKQDIAIEVQKAPRTQVSITEKKTETSSRSFFVESGDRFSCMSDKASLSPSFIAPTGPRLSLGSHRKQDWDIMRSRLDLKEIIPIWYRLGQLVPPTPLPSHLEGTAILLERCQKAVIEKQREDIAEHLHHLILAGFNGMMTPRLIDTDYHGLVPNTPLTDSTTSPLILLQEGTRLIQSLFIQNESNNEERVAVLPVLPIEFHCGRLLGVPCGNWGTVDIEWSKKQLRRMIFHAKRDGKIQFQFQHHLKRFRLSGQISAQATECGMPINIQKGYHYAFDRFEKG